ncbi:MAG: rubredoxin [Oceanospirillaceae bacterium]|nr:rubredoxin [Oceanospirillaceae bacterium]MBT13611.1 rubredoxin [Oceanospirillaceae bacterium]|tara:strand:+ start:13502 stop:13732 length:231 start_codon:yes stop_codon:yes gene_type:complete
MSTPTKTFEGSYLGDNSQLSDDAVLECKICWYQYHPEDGDADQHIPPATPFSQLPDSWRCPQCDGERDQFMVVDDH